MGYKSRGSVASAGMASSSDTKRGRALKAFTDEEIKAFIRGVLLGEIFTSFDVAPRHLGTHLPLVFMPIAFGLIDGFRRRDLPKIGCFWAYKRDAIGRNIDGYPVFPVAHVMNQDDTARAYEAIGRERERLARMEV